MGLTLDIVPNHMLATSENPWWSDVLEFGRDSQWAAYFDIDWSEDNKIVLPILGQPLRDVLWAGDLVIESKRGVSMLRYHFLQ